MDAYDRINQTLIFKELAKALEERGGRLSFSSLLVTPIQRIPRYLLLLRVRTSTAMYPALCFAVLRLTCGLLCRTS